MNVFICMKFYSGICRSGYSFCCIPSCKFEEKNQLVKPFPFTKTKAPNFSLQKNQINGCTLKTEEIKTGLGPSVDIGLICKLDILFAPEIIITIIGVLWRPRRDADDLHLVLRLHLLHPDLKSVWLPEDDFHKLDGI